MPKFYIKIQNEIFEVDAPNEESLSEIAEQIASEMGLTQPTQPDFLKPFAKRRAQTEQRISGREDQLTSVVAETFPGLFPKKEKPTKPGISFDPFGIRRSLKTIGGVSERAFAGISNPLLEIQEQRAREGAVSLKDILSGKVDIPTGPGKDIPLVKEIFKASKEGLSGERISTFADVPETAGFGKPLSAVIGFAAEGALFDVATRGLFTSSAQKGMQFIDDSASLKFMDKTQVLKRAKVLAKGVDELGQITDDAFKAGLDSVPNSAVSRETINAFVEEIKSVSPQTHQKIMKSPLIRKAKKVINITPRRAEKGIPIISPTKTQTIIEIIPDVKNLQTMKNIANTSISPAVKSGKRAANVLEVPLSDIVWRMRDEIVGSSDEMAKVYTEYKRLKIMEKSVNSIIHDGKGNIIANKLQRLFKKGAEPGGVRERLEEFADLWPKAQTIISDMKSLKRGNRLISKTWAVTKGLTKAIAQGAGGAGIGLGVGKVLFGGE